MRRDGPVHLLPRTEGAALLLDCRSLEARSVPIDAAARLVVCDTMVRHEIASGDYNLRRRECEQAVALLRTQLPGVKALRDVDAETLAAHARLLPPVLLRRARHVVTENARTLAAAGALDAGDLRGCGRLMEASHVSLRDDYAVSCAELDLMVELAAGLDGVYGARMMGGGFGGCTINLVAAAASDRFAQNMRDAYRERTGVAPDVFCCAPGPGASQIDV